jgi:hypothetical protein
MMSTDESTARNELHSNWWPGWVSEPPEDGTVTIDGNAVAPIIKPGLAMLRERITKLERELAKLREMIGWLHVIPEEDLMPEEPEDPQ